MSTFLILSADRWSFPDEKTGEIRTGATAYAVSPLRQSSPTELGDKPLKLSLTVEAFEQLRATGTMLPVVAACDISMRPGRDLKPTPTIVGVHSVRSVDVF